VWVVVPDRPVRSVVVLGHGWKLAPPSPAHSWVGQFQPRLDHLAAGGSAVIFLRYQVIRSSPRLPATHAAPKSANRLLDGRSGRRLTA
jgi:hypothetical protein